MAAQVNGEAPSSAFLSHLSSIPLISDTISSFKSNPYGAKSLSFTTAVSQRLSQAPLLPYFSKSYQQYLSPYVQKADSLGDSTLSSLESRFPAVKKPTGELYHDSREFVFFPLKMGTEGREYVVGVFGSEKKKAGQEGLVGYGRALIGTGLVVGGDAYKWVSDYLAGQKAEGKEVLNGKLDN